MKKGKKMNTKNTTKNNAYTLSKSQAPIDKYKEKHATISKDGKNQTIGFAGISVGPIRFDSRITPPPPKIFPLSTPYSQPHPLILRHFTLVQMAMWTHHYHKLSTRLHL